MIAYSWRGRIGEIHLMTADGKHIKKLSRPLEGDWDPDWINPAAFTVSPAGNSITIWGRLKKLALDRPYAVGGAVHLSDE